MDSLSVWQDKYDIKLYEADALGRASITSLANYVQNSEKLPDKVSELKNFSRGAGISRELQRS